MKQDNILKCYLEDFNRSLYFALLPVDKGLRDCFKLKPGTYHLKNLSSGKTHHNMLQA